MGDINGTLAKVVEDKNIQEIRAVLAAFIVTDQGFSKGILAEKIQYCISKGILESDLFESFDGGPLNENPVTWTNEYYAEQRTKFRGNFSVERLKHLKRVGQKLFGSNKIAPRPSYPDPDNPLPSGTPWLIFAGVAVAAIVLWLILS
jgi:hypothetical protein